MHQLFDETLEVIDDYNIINFEILKFFFDFNGQSMVKNYNQ